MPPKVKLSQSQLKDALDKSIVPLNETKAFFKGMFYGTLGTGKSVESMLLAQKITPPDKEILYVDFLEGWVSIMNHPGLDNRTQRMEYKGISQIEYLGQALQQGLYPQFGTVILDEVSAMQKFDLNIVTAAHTASDKYKEAEDEDDPQWPSYKVNGNRVGRAVEAILRAKVNVILVSHMRTKQERGVMQQQPSISPAVRETINEFLHLVGRIETDVTVRNNVPTYTYTVHVHPTTTVLAKCRVGGIPTVSVDLKTLNTKIVEWLNKGGELVDEQEVVDDSKLISPIEASESDFVEYKDDSDE